MIKPYIKNEHNARIVEVEEYGNIDLTKLPIRLDKEGVFEIGWVTQHGINCDKSEVLSEYGGRNMSSFGGRQLGVLRELE